MDLLKSIEIFQEVCKQMSFSQAANQLNLVPSAVSRQVSELEKHLGVRLLQRTTRSIGLTEDGRRYLPKMDAISQGVRELKGQTDEDQNHEENIRITAPPIFGPQFLADALNSYMQQHPYVSVSTTMVNREINLIEEGYDLALRVGELEDSNMVARVVGKFSLSIVASPKYLEIHGAPKHPKDLVARNCIINTLSKSPHRWGFREGGRKFSVKVDGRCAANDDMLLQSFACSGLGIAFLPTYVTCDEVDKGCLILLLEEFIPDPLPIAVVYPSRHLLSRAKRNLIGHLIENAERSIFRQLSKSNSDLPPSKHFRTASDS
jgi:LysR family transcriptional regulator for bpeEF and oprC